MLVDLLATTDGMVWAQEFVKTLREHPDADPHDQGFMVGWFANAIEAGRTAGAVALRDSQAPTEETT